jgi:hypothetical protein
MSPSALRQASHCARWLSSLFRAGARAQIIALEILEPGQDIDNRLNDREKFWIAKGRMSGLRLTNITDGGEGRGHPVSEDTRRKLSLARAGVPVGPMSDVTKKKISEALTGRIVSEETKRKQSQIMKRLCAEGRGRWGKRK